MMWKLLITDHVLSSKVLTDSEIMAIADIISFKELFLMTVPKLATFVKCSVAVRRQCFSLFELLEPWPVPGSPGYLTICGEGSQKTKKSPLGFLNIFYFISLATYCACFFHVYAARLRSRGTPTPCLGTLVGMRGEGGKEPLKVLFNVLTLAREPAVGT